MRQLHKCQRTDDKVGVLIFVNENCLQQIRNYILDLKFLIIYLHVNNAVTCAHCHIEEFDIMQTNLREMFIGHFMMH